MQREAVGVAGYLLRVLIRPFVRANGSSRTGHLVAACTCPPLSSPPLSSPFGRHGQVRTMYMSRMNQSVTD